MTTKTLTPKGSEYLSTDANFKQWTQKGRDLTLFADTSAPTGLPQVLLDGAGNAQLSGALTITAPSVGNITIFKLPSEIVPFVPLSGEWPIVVRRGDAYIPNSLILSASASAIISVSVDEPGNYETEPTLTTSGPGIGAVFDPRYQGVAVAFATSGTDYVTGDTIDLPTGMGDTTVQLTIDTVELSDIVGDAPGTGYVPQDTITLAGGTPVLGQNAIVSVDTTQLSSAAVNAPGIGYNVTDGITLDGGTPLTRAVLTVNTLQLVQTTINAAGTGYAVNDTITLANGTFSVAAVLTVLSVGGSGELLTFSVTNGGNYTIPDTVQTQGSTSGGGTGATFQTTFYGVESFTITTPGEYSVNDSNFTQFSTTGAGTGATFNNTVFGTSSIGIVNPGVYSVSSPTFTQGSTSGGGTGATFQTAVFGVNSATITTPGSTKNLPSNPIPQAATSGSGTGATMNMRWGYLVIAMLNGGLGYDETTKMVILGGNPSEDAVLVINLSPSTNGFGIITNAVQVDDIIVLDSVRFITQSY